MPDQLFWELTPLLFGKLIDRHNTREETKNLRVGLIAAELRNSNRAKETDKVWTAFDFFPREISKTEQTDEEMLVAMKAWVVRTSHSSVRH